MIGFFLLILILIIFISFYLMKNFSRRSFFFFFLLSGTSLGYFLKGNMESFYFYEKNNEIIENIILSKDQIDELDPKRLIIYLEEKLKKNPKDQRGWLILARTCSVSGYLQKADLYFKKGLDIFPTDENLLFDYALLKKNVNNFKSALEILYKLKVIYPNNIKARELILDILVTMNSSDRAKKELNDMMKIKGFNKNKILEFKKKYNL